MRDGALVVARGARSSTRCASRATGPLVEIRGRLYALRWTALRTRAELTGLRPRWTAPRAGTSSRRRCACSPGPSQNFVYADVDGRIAWYSAGRLPIRRGGRRLAALRRRVTADGDWIGLRALRGAARTSSIRPSGRIVTANNRLVGTDYPHRVTRGGIGALARGRALRARWRRARDGRRTTWRALQGERLSIPHRDLARALLEAAARHPGDAAWDEVARDDGGLGRADGGGQPPGRPGRRPPSAPSASA